MTELSRNLVCICIRGGVEIWVEQDRSETMVSLLTGQNPPQFVKYDGRLINRADVVGIFMASDMENMTRRKNNQIQCKQGTWHDKGEKCVCISLEEKRHIEKREEAIKNCKKCTNGWIAFGNERMSKCECQNGL